MPSARPPAPEPLAPLNIDERGRDADGAPATSDRRLYVSLLLFDGARETAPLADALDASGLPGVLYADAHNPRGVGLLAFDEDPAFFIEAVRPFVNAGPFAALTPLPERTLLGRTYTIGYEHDLHDVLVGRPRRRAADPATPWHVWYPIRRAAAFELLPETEQRAMLMEHGGIGRRFGEAGLANDIRLACHGLDRDNADFIAGIVARTLTGASALVQAMRRTQQTARFLEHMGPFFVGRAVWQRA